MKTSKIFAHRGYSGKFPENTMLAFREALHHRADGIELDVHFTKDKQLVVCHDETIDRTANGHGQIKEMTLAELKAYRFDQGFEHLNAAKETIAIPTLDEVLAWLKETDLLLNIEIKNNIYQYEGIEESVIELIDHYDIVDRIIISSFNHYSIRYVKALRPDIKCGFLTFSNILDIADYCTNNGVEYYHPHYLTLRPNEITELAAANIGINPYTINEPIALQEAIDNGMQYIITNEVETAVALNSK